MTDTEILVILTLFALFVGLVSGWLGEKIDNFYNPKPKGPKS